LNQDERESEGEAPPAQEEPVAAAPPEVGETVEGRPAADPQATGSEQDRPAAESVPAQPEQAQPAERPDAADLAREQPVAEPAAAPAAAQREEGPPTTRPERPERPRPPPGDRRRRHFGRRKVCSFCVEKAQSIDYKDPVKLRRYLSDRGRIEARRKTGTCAKHQRWLATALKRARHLALLPYTPEHIRISGMFAARR
jgi:small subunit ribosomal protein S18